MQTIQFNSRKNCILSRDPVPFKRYPIKQFLKRLFHIYSPCPRTGRGCEEHASRPRQVRRYFAPPRTQFRSRRDPGSHPGCSSRESRRIPHHPSWFCPPWHYSSLYVLTMQRVSLHCKILSTGCSISEMPFLALD